MAYYTLSVPTVAQEKSDVCWHASAQMIWWYWQGVTHRQGPMNTLANNYQDNKPVTPADFIRLAKTVGMQEVTRSTTYTSDGLKSLLTDNGPLWCAGYWYGPGHIIVLTGVDGETIYLNDPDGGVRKTGLISWFNTKLANSLAGCLMSKDPSAY